jgi:hypothetical protein
MFGDMRRLLDRRTGVVVTVTGAGSAVVGLLVFGALGLLAGPAPGPDPVEAANPGSVASGPGGPPPAQSPGGPSAPSSKSSQSSTTGPSWLPGPSGGTPSPSAATHADAPSDNLRRLADALRFAYKSTTGAMVAPAGLNITAPVEISVLWDEGGPRPTRATQDYNNTTGNRSIFLFPAGDGRARAVKSVVTMAERRADGADVYAVRSNVTIEPLYDITFSPVVFTLLTDCEVFETEVKLYRVTPTDGVGLFERSMNEGQSATISDFGQTYREVGQSSNLRTPYFDLINDDGPWGEFPGPPGTNPNPPLPLGEDRTVDVGISERKNSACVGRIRYGIKFQLREYLYLE